MEFNKPCKLARSLGQFQTFAGGHRGDRRRECCRLDFSEAVESSTGEYIRGGIARGHYAHISSKVLFTMTSSYGH